MLVLLIPKVRKFFMKKAQQASDLVNTKSQYDWAKIGLAVVGTVALVIVVKKAVK